ncbi:MAG: helix-turn-helix transcriptional regulator [Ruminococcaceae bacterium]|nr:helix-turn-helix transcriptional regulator [Oscillospiraceae bacterium]
MECLQWRAPVCIEKAFGTGFREQLTKMRMRSAKKFLRDGEKDVSQVAEVVGYQSYNGFYIAFKRETGMTPAEYRKNIERPNKKS